MIRTTTTGEKGDSGLLQRAMLLLAAAMIVAMMVVATAAPALAIRQRGSGGVFACDDGTLPEPVIVPASDKHDLVKQAYICTKDTVRR